MTTRANKLLILAGNATQAAKYCRENDIPLSSARWIMSAEQVYGLLNPEYVVVGTFWNHPQAVPIWQALVSVSKAHPPQAPPELEPFLHKNFPVFSPLPAPPPPKVQILDVECPKCGLDHPENEFCPNCGPPVFKHIEDVPPPKKKFKSIRK